MTHPKTLDEFLAQGGNITTLAPAPTQKIDTRSTGAYIVDELYRRGAITLTQFTKELGSKPKILSAIKRIQNKGIPIIKKDDYIALDATDLPPNTMPIVDEHKCITHLTENQISFAIGKYHLNSKHLVAVNNFYWTGYECDIFAITKSLKPIEFEIKITRADFLADAKKEKWQRPISVWKHYYIMPEHIYKPDMLDKLAHKNSGILTLNKKDGWIWINEKKKAIANDKVKPIDAKQMVNISRLISMRLWQGVTP